MCEGLSRSNDNYMELYRDSIKMMQKELVEKKNIFDNANNAAFLTQNPSQFSTSSILSSNAGGRHKVWQSYTSGALKK
jgi:hypothetical protein